MKWFIASVITFGFIFISLYIANAHNWDTVWFFWLVLVLPGIVEIFFIGVVISMAKNLLRWLIS